jgi:hypothetical protein
VRVRSGGSGGNVTKTVSQEEAAPPEKRPYERPRILHREPLEAMAAVCTPSPAKRNPGLCPQGPISS